MKTNVITRAAARTYEGAAAVPPKNPMAELRRAVSACMLFEDTFYESGEDIATRIEKLVGECDTAQVSMLALEARKQMNLRHAPLWLIAALVKHGKCPEAYVIAGVIQRADEMGELIAMVRKGGKRALPKQFKKGIAAAFAKFDAYQLGKYNRANAGVKLRDVLRIVHPKPANEEQSALWKSIIDGTLPAPDTWEVQLSGGADKKETFERLLAEGRLGYMALLRNLRGMSEAGVDANMVSEAIIARNGAHRVLPFRFLSAVQHAPQFAPALDVALQAAVQDLPALPGKTVVCVDTSGSMQTPISAKSQMHRSSAAASLASLVKGDVRILVFATGVAEVPRYAGLAGVQIINGSIGQVGHGTDIAKAVEAAGALKPDRIIVITDEQSATAVGAPPNGAKGYIINVAGYRNGIGFGDWVRIDGFSENTLAWIMEHERSLTSPETAG